MRPNTFVSAMLLAAASYAAVPHSFSAGRSVVAQEMNENFAAIDTALQNRATKSDLSPIPTKADTGTVSSLTRKVDDLAKSKQNILGFTPMNKAGDTAAGVVASKAGGYFGQAGGVPISANALLSAYAPKSFANMYMQGAGAGYVAKTANGEWSFGTRDDGLSKSAVGSWVINDASEARLWGNKAGTNILTPLNVSGAATISGGLRIAPTSTLTLDGDEATPIFNVHNDNSLLEKQLGAGASIRHALDFSWYESHWQIGNVRSGDVASLGFGITNGNSDIRFLVNTSGAIVYGNMVATGTVTAQTKGSSVPDYVFEPTYKLA